MRLKTPALLTGPYDWDSTLLPVHEFEMRLRNVHRVLAERDVVALILHGNSAEYGALAYLTNFVPKLGPAFALVAPNFPIRLLVSGSPTMILAAKCLTWVDDVRPIGDLKTSLNTWLADIHAAPKSYIGLWGQNQMSLRPYNAIRSAIESREQLKDVADALESLRLRKSSVELDLCRHSCRILQQSIQTMTQAFYSGCGTCSISLAAEQAAYRSGAQDARVYIGAHPGGLPVFIDTLRDLVFEPALAYVAVRSAGYWAEGFITLTKSHSTVLARAQDGLAGMLRSIRSGMTFEELSSVAENNTSPYRLHPLVKNSVGNGIGLSIEEPCESQIPTRIEPGGIYTLRCGAAGEGVENAIVSAMVSVGESCTDILWSTLDNRAASSP